MTFVGKGSLVSIEKAVNPNGDYSDGEFLSAIIQGLIDAKTGSIQNSLMKLFNEFRENLNLYHVANRISDGDLNLR